MNTREQTHTIEQQSHSLLSLPSASILGVVDNALVLTEAWNGKTACQSGAGNMELDYTEILIDVSIVNAVRSLNAKTAKAIEYNCELIDENLLPLRRMSEMMSDLGKQRPPITVVKSGQLYKVVNGRHRLARAILLSQKIPAVVLNTGHSDYVLSGGESNPGPDETLIEMVELKQPRRQQRRQRRKGQKHCNRYKQSLVPKDQIGDILDKVIADSRASCHNGCSDHHLHNTALLKDRKGCDNDDSERGECGISFGDELVHSIVQQKIDAKTAATLIADWDKIKPTRSDLELMIRKSKCGIIYDCPCSKVNYGFPNCGCPLKDQFIAFYNKLVAIDEGVIEVNEHKVSVPAIENKTTCVDLDEIVTVKLSDKEVQTAEPRSKMTMKNDVIVRQRKGIYKYLKTPGFFSFKDKFNHHHESIAKVKDQSKANFLVVPDDMIIDDLYAYLRRNEFEEYPDRKTKLAHMTKLAAKWDQGKFKLSEQGKGIGTVELNKYFVTIQKVTDAKDTEFLLQEVNAYHSNSKRHRFLGLLGCFPTFHKFGRLN